MNIAKTKKEAEDFFKKNNPVFITCVKNKDIKLDCYNYEQAMSFFGDKE